MSSTCGSAIESWQGVPLGCEKWKEAEKETVAYLTVHTMASVLFMQLIITSKVSVESGIALHNPNWIMYNLTEHVYKW